MRQFIFIFICVFFVMYFINKILSFNEFFHNFEKKNVKIIPRDKNPDGNCDMVFILLIHQNKKMIDYMIRNIKKNVHGNYKIFIHYNGTDKINENDYDDNIWFNRNPIKTERFKKSLPMAVIDTMKYALDYVKFTNIMIISSGSVFYKKYTVPTDEYIGLNNYKNQLGGGNSFNNIFDKKYIDSQFIKNLENLNIPIWQYGHIEHDSFLLEKLKKRDFQYITGGQMSGIVIPYDCIQMIVEDFYPMEYKNENQYCAEELYFPIYLYNYSLLKKLPINHVETITDWDNNYLLDDIQKIKNMISKNLSGHLLCKIPEDTEHPCRKYFEELN